MSKVERYGLITIMIANRLNVKNRVADILIIKKLCKKI